MSKDEGELDVRVDLTTPIGLREVCNRVETGVRPRPPVIANGIYCPVCGGHRRVMLDLRAFAGHRFAFAPPLLATLECLQCTTCAQALLHDGPEGEAVAIFWPKAGGLSTPNTPPPVAYYLDQAIRAESVSARSAAVAMYRAALEQLLYDQGYTTGMLTAKIVALEGDIAGGNAKKWAKELAPEFLKVIRDLGNGSIHPNGGDIGKQAALDVELIREVNATMQELLDLIYEEPVRRQLRLAKLQSAASVVK